MRGRTKGASTKTKRKVVASGERRKDRNWARKMAAVTPPPCRQRMRGRSRVASSVGSVVAMVCLDERSGVGFYVDKCVGGEQAVGLLCQGRRNV